MCPKEISMHILTSRGIHTAIIPALKNLVRLLHRGASQESGGNLTKQDEFRVTM
jgi:hypothetical protein